MMENSQFARLAGGPDVMLYGNKSLGTDTEQQKKLLADLLIEGEATQIYPASLPQERLWFLDQLRDINAAYNVHVGLWLTGPLDLPALGGSLREIVRRHDSFRTTFWFNSGKLFQLVSKHVPVDLPMDDVSDAANPIQKAYEIAQQEVHAPFNLSTGPLFRTRLIRASSEDHVFLCTMHHIVTDSWSMQLFVKELRTLYRALCDGRPSPLAELPIGYGDYSEWQRESFASDRVREEIEYWKQKLHAAAPVLELPKDAPRPSEQTFSGASQTVELPQALVGEIKQLGARYNSTPFMVLLAAFELLLYRYSGQPDVLVGVPVAGRNRIETEGLIGFFINTVVLRSHLSGNPRFLDLLGLVRQTTLEAFANSDVPFEKVVEVLQPARSLSYNPIFQVMFSTIKAAVESHSFGNLIAYPYVVSTATSIFDLSATLIEATDGQWYMQFEYNTDLFSRERIAQMLADYHRLLPLVARQPDIHILDVEVSRGGAAKSVGESDLQVPEENKVLDSAPRELSREEQDSGLEKNRELLIEIWKKVLGVNTVSIHDNFFDIGGHSLLAARLIRDIESATGKTMRVSAIFRAPTIESFSRLLAETNPRRPEPVILQLRGGKTQDRLFAVAVPGVDTFGFGLLAHHLRGEHSVYKLQAASPVILDRPFAREEVEGLVREYIAAMKSVQPAGPYALIAMCYGVVLAQAMILALEAQGDEVSFFAILDTWVLENSMRRPLWAVDYYRQRLDRFLKCPVQERWAIGARILRRVFRPKRESEGSGWVKAYWPEKGFQTPHFEAPVVLFKRPQQPYYYVRDPNLGWTRRTRGGVEVYEIDSGHVEMLREPYVRVIAETLARRLTSSASAGRSRLVSRSDAPEESPSKLVPESAI
ncbi:MAG: hypothetical protein JO266_16555 [Acidobacteria bacterium]|nr:hypothetical protein [Acidobacteriota bacterium]